MKYRWLVVLACVLVTACSPAKEEAKKVAETKPANAKAPETKSPEVKAPEAKAPETKAPETKSPETKAPETKAPETKAPATAEELLADYKVAMDEWMVKARAAKPAERGEVMNSRPGPEFAKKFREMAADNEGSEMAAAALGWLAANSDKPEEKVSAIATLLEKHADSPSMKDVAGAIVAGKPSKSAEDNLRKIMKDSPHREVRGAATHHLVSFFDRYGSLADRIDELAENPQAAEFFGEDGIDYLRNLKVENAEIEKLYESIVNDYSDVVISQFGRETKIGEAAKNGLFEMRNLAVGCVAPNIEGADLDGKEFTLADYRGKVVMLDFWGDW